MIYCIILAKDFLKVFQVESASWRLTAHTTILRSCTYTRLEVDDDGLLLPRVRVHPGAGPDAGHPRGGRAQVGLLEAKLLPLGPAYGVLVHGLQDNDVSFKGLFDEFK